MINQFKEHLLEIMPALRGFAVSKTGDPMVADDVVQEACARMLGRAEDLTSRRVNLVAYGMRVVDNIITDAGDKITIWRTSYREPHSRGPVW